MSALGQKAIDLGGHGQRQRRTSYSFEHMRDDVTARLPVRSLYRCER